MSVSDNFNLKTYPKKQKPTPADSHSHKTRPGPFELRCPLLSPVASIVWLEVSLLQRSVMLISWGIGVVDAQTGAPISGIECYGGASSRADLTPQAFSDENGNYVVTYDDELDLTNGSSTHSLRRTFLIC